LRGLVLALAFVTVPAWAQDRAPAPKKKQVAHKKATPEQIRRFNELQKKQAK
jgi:hypothetical protein